MNKLKTSGTSSFRWTSQTLALVLLMIFTAASASSASKPADASSLATAAAGGPSTDSTTEVKIDNFAFTPGIIRVKAGTQLTWINHDDIPHTVDSTEGKFKSAALDTEDKFQFRFTQPGEYSYYCRMHPKMTGKVIVQP
jgi:plastocyanin